MRARLVGRLPRSSRQPVEVGESGDLRQGRRGGGARAIAGGCSCRNVRRSRTRASAEDSALTFRQFAERYKERHVIAKGLALATTIDYRLKPLIERFGDFALIEIRTADVEDFIADLKKPRVDGRTLGRPLATASVNRTIELLRHMMNWAIGRGSLKESDAVSTRNRNAHSQAARRQSAAPSTHGGRRSQAPEGRTAAASFNDRHRSRHRDAAGRDARAALRGR